MGFESKIYVFQLNLDKNFLCFFIFTWICDNVASLGLHHRSSHQSGQVQDNPHPPPQYLGKTMLQFALCRLYKTKDKHSFVKRQINHNENILLVYVRFSLIFQLFSQKVFISCPKRKPENSQEIAKNFMWKANAFRTLENRPLASSTKTRRAVTHHHSCRWWSALCTHTEIHGLHWCHSNMAWGWVPEFIAWFILGRWFWMSGWSSHHDRGTPLGSGAARQNLGWNQQRANNTIWAWFLNKNHSVHLPLRLRAPLHDQ